MFYGINVQTVRL